MDTKKKDLNRIAKIFELLENTKKCIVKKCKKLHHENMKANRESSAKLAELFAKLQRDKVDVKTFNKEQEKLRLKMNNSKEKLELAKCQMKNCYDETRKMILNSIQTILDNTDKQKNKKKYQQFKELEKKFKKKITAEEAIELDNMVIKKKI